MTPVPSVSEESMAEPVPDSFRVSICRVKAIQHGRLDDVVERPSLTLVCPAFFQ